MKKALLCIIAFICFTTFLPAQDTWAPVGEKWYFTQGSYIEGIAKTYQTYESVKDTVIDNRNCRMIIETNRIYDSAPQETFYMYSENDSVFFRGKDYNKFCLLYDFSASMLF
jgi:hypothetical protein